MLRLIGLVVVVLFVLSLAHGERTGMDTNRINARAENLVDAVTGALADGMRGIGDTVFGPVAPGSGGDSNLRDLARNFDGLARSANTTSRRAMADMVLRACPSLGLVCQPAPGEMPEGAPGRRRPAADDLR